MQGFNDDTESQIQELNASTRLFTIVFSSVPSMTFTPIIDLLNALGKRGIMTIMSFRKTVGSRKKIWPGSKELFGSLNKPNQILTEEERLRLKRWIMFPLS